MRAYMAALVVAFVALSALADSDATTQHELTGNLVGFGPGEWMSVANDMTNPRGLRIALDERTVYERGDQGSALSPAEIKPGVRVTVWFTGNVADRDRVAHKVRVLTNPTAR